MSSRIKTFGRLIDAGDAGDHKRTFVVSDKNEGFKDVRIEIDTDDCDSKHAQAFKIALIATWNALQDWFVYPANKPTAPGYYLAWVLPGKDTSYEAHFEQAYYEPNIDEWEGAAECGPLNDGCYVSHWKNVNAPAV